MKRDLDLCRQLLLHLDEQADEKKLSSEDIALDLSRPLAEVGYHLKLLYQAGFLEARVYRGQMDQHQETKTPMTLDHDQIFFVVPISLTWKGHEFLETIRDPEVWRKSKEGAKKIGSFGIDIIEDLAKGYLKKKVKDLTGVEIDV